MLDTSVAAVKSSLQRARARMADAAPSPDDVVEPTAPEARRLLDAYVTAFETGDVKVLTAVLRADATLELLPGRAWFAGKVACSRVLAGAVGSPGDWRMDRTVANGQPRGRGVPARATVRRRRARCASRRHRGDHRLRRPGPRGTVCVRFRAERVPAEPRARLTLRWPGLALVRPGRAGQPLVAGQGVFHLTVLGARDIRQ